MTQVESIYWSLVSAYEDEQAKERALHQSTQLTSDNRKQLEIGTLAPLDVVTSDSQVATDKQALIQSQSNLEYQQLLDEAGHRPQPERSHNSRTRRSCRRTGLAWTAYQKKICL